MARSVSVLLLSFIGSSESFGFGKQVAVDRPERVAWQSIMQLPGGYATSCREMMRALDAEGVRLTYSYAYDGWATVPAESERTGDHLLDIIRSRHSPDRPPVSVTYAQGDALTRNRGRYKIGFTKRSCVTSLQLRPPPRPENRAAAGEGLTTKGIITLR